MAYASNEEIWKDIENYEGFYKVSSLGRIKSFKKSQFGICLTPSYDKDGYKIISLYNLDHIGLTKKVHRLVAQTFIQNPLNYPIVNHIDGNKGNNNIINLEWCTASHNNKHAYENGLITEYKGENNHSAKLSNKDVLEIYNLAWERRLTYEKIAKKYNICLEEVGHIKYGRVWSSVTHHKPGDKSGSVTNQLIIIKDIRGIEKLSKNKLTSEQILKIYNLSWNSGYTHPYIGNMFNIKCGLVSKIKRGEVWNRITHHLEYSCKS